MLDEFDKTGSNELVISLMVRCSVTAKGHGAIPPSRTIVLMPLPGVLSSVDVGVASEIASRLDVYDVPSRGLGECSCKG